MVITTYTTGPLNVKRKRYILFHFCYFKIIYSLSVPQKSVALQITLDSFEEEKQ